MKYLTLFFVLIVSSRLDAAPACTQGEGVKEIGLELVAEGFVKPAHVTHAGDGSGRLFVVEQDGRIRVLKNGVKQGKPFLDIKDRVDASASEMGLLSVAFHPQFKANGRFFVDYTTYEGRQMKTRISEFRVTPGSGTADKRSERIIMTVDQPYTNHNGGLVKFGLDGKLYIGFGDGGSGGDPDNNGQRLDILLGKILRIDVDRVEPYGVPPDNPFFEKGMKREIWAYGLRNPWRFSFDACTGKMWCADVGQVKWEEIHIIEKGKNYGWKIMEGNHCFEPEEGCDKTGLELPVAEYGHDDGCSVTGGYVYRGSKFPAMNGHYFYGDFCSGRIWALNTEKPSAGPVLLHAGNERISSFGEDEEGELYLTDYTGSLHRITA